MNNLLSFKQRQRPSLSFAENQSQLRFIEPMLFFGGVVISVVLPETICSIYGGMPAAIAFSGSLIIGTSLGIYFYRNRKFTITKCVSKDSLPKAPPSSGGPFSKAA